MSVSFSPCEKSSYNFMAQRSSTNVLDNVVAGRPAMDPNRVKPQLVEDNTSKLSDNEKREIQTKKFQNVLKCLLAVVLFVNVIYFVLKRKIRIAKHENEVSNFDASLLKKKSAPFKDMKLFKVVRAIMNGDLKVSEIANGGIERFLQRENAASAPKPNVPPIPKTPPKPVQVDKNADISGVQDILNGFMP